MYNELLFFIAVIITTTATIGALRLGKEALIAVICLYAVLVNLFVSKQIILFGLCATASDSFAIGASLALNLLQEYWGAQIVRKTLLLSFCASFLYTIFSQIQILYTPHILDTAHIHFCAILEPLPRIIAASLAVYIIVQYIDYRIYNSLKVRFDGRYFTLRNMISLSFTQLLDTILFSFLGLYGTIVPTIEALYQIIIISYCIKILSIVTAVPITGYIRKYISVQ